MMIVADTSPINYLLQIELVDLLERIYDEIAIPQEVERELKNTASPTLVRNWAASFPFWVNVLPVTIQEPDAVSRLDPGERAAIALAIEIGSPSILIDERRGRHVARNILGLEVVGTLGVLQKAHALGWIDGLQSFDELCSATNFRSSPALRTEFLTSLRR